MPGFNATPNLRMHRSRRSGVQSSPARGRVTLSGFDYLVLCFFNRRN